MVLVRHSWSVVNYSGFSRHHALVAKNDENTSEKYYRSLLDSIYEKTKVALKEKLVKSEAESITVFLDAWLSFYHHYLGMIVYFMSKEWKRVKFCIYCSKFD